MLRNKAFFHEPTNTVTYLVWETPSGHAILIDPVLDYEPHRAALSYESADEILIYVRKLDLKLTWVLDTHAHADHLTAAHYIKQHSGASIGISARITEVQAQFKPLFRAEDVTPNGSAFDRLFEDGETLQLGSEAVTVMYTPGHTPACVSYLIGDMVFVGDTLFMPDYGTARADFPGGDAAELYDSIRRILSLPYETRIMVGHDYLPEGRDTYAWEATVAQHKRNNVHISEGVSKKEYVDMRNTRDATLNAPRLILPALQVNIRAGALPPVSEDGHHYMTIPINRM